MLRIYDEQTEAFARAATREFEDRMDAHLHRFFREHCEQLGPEALRELIRHGIGRAASHGIVSEHDVALYLNLTISLGRDFDSDPLLPWARAALDDTAQLEPSRRMGRLYRSTLERTQVPVPGDDAYVD